MTGRRKKSAAILAEGGATSSTTYAANPTSSSRAWAVITTKWNGAKIVFGTYADRISAQRVVEQLERIHCRATVEPSVAGDLPGHQRRKP